MKKIFKIDCGLYPLGLLTILSGIGLHIAGHGSNHNTWEIWAVIHSVLSVSFTILLAYHIPRALSMVFSLTGASSSIDGSR